MRKNIKAVALVYVLLSSCVYAGTIEIKNETDKTMKVFLREHGKEKREHDKEKLYHTVIVPKHEKLSLTVDKALFNRKEDHYLYDIIASSSLDSKVEPEWRLLAGECAKLFSGHETTVVIQETAGGLKTSCKVIETHP